ASYGASDLQRSGNSRQQVRNPRHSSLIQCITDLPSGSVLEQSGNLSILIDVDTNCSRNFRQTRHGHDLSGQGYDKACACGNLQLAYGYFEIGRSPQLRLVVGQAVLCLRNTDRAVAESQV